MSSPASPRSPLPSVKPHETQSSTGQSQEGDTDWMEELDCSGYDDYIREDLNSRVFVDFYAFMKYVLHIPDDWKTTWGPAIEAVKVDPDFKSQYAEYCKGCDKFGTKEEISFVPSVNTANAALDIFSRSTFDGIPPISPHLVVLDKDCQPSKVGDPYGVNPLHVLEVKGRGGALCDGRNMPRLVVDEVDPIVNHALLFQPSRYATKRSNPLTESKTGSESPFVSSNSRKRPADRSSTIDQPPKKELRTKSASGRILDDSVGSKVDEDEGSSTTEPEIQRQAILAIRVCRYLLGMFSAHLLRSHATVTLVDRGRLQLYHANRSVILVSSTINLLEGDGLSKFIAVIIALGRPPFEQNSVLDTLAKKNAELVKGLGVSVENKVVEREDQLEFQGGESQGKFTVDLGDVISCRLATVGRSTVVLQATSDQWPKTELVVKISWPDSGRARESDFLEKASLEAEKSAGKWATKHLPRVFYTADVVFDENSALESVARLFKDAKFVNGEYVYERRTLRIIVQERLYPLKSLTNVRDVGQAFLDVACIHRWLFDLPGILHRDLSPNNIMCRFIEEMNAKGKLERKVYGVLTDYDLSSWKEALEGDYTRTSQQRTGTPPYMAFELLKGISTTHLYRHDLESLFYVMLLTTARHTINPTKGGVVMREGIRPYQEWFSEQRYNALASHKWAFLSFEDPIDLSPAFEGFRPWLMDMQDDFSNGFYERYRPSNKSQRTREQAEGLAGEVTSTTAPFDDETLGGRVDYSTIIDPVRDLEGELGGLIIRYETPTSTV